MTEKEFDQIRNSYSRSKTRCEKTEEGSGYFTYFKIRCLICLIIFLSMLILDRQIGLRQYEDVALCMQLLGKEITVEECLALINLNE